MIDGSSFPKRQAYGRGSGGWLGAALALVLLQAMPNLCYPIGRDQATYGVIARGLLHGKTLYQGLWDNKPPGIFYIYTMIVKVFGPALWSMGAVDVLWLLGISLCVFRFVERTLGRRAAFLAVVVNAAMHIRVGYWDAAQPETFVMLFIFASYFRLAHSGPRPKLKEAGAGVLFAAAFWTKYNAIAFLPFLLLLPYLELKTLDRLPRRLRLRVPGREWMWTAARFAAGFLLSCAGELFYLWFSGSWNAFLEEHFKVLPRYAAMAFESTPHYWFWAAGRIHFWLGLWTVCAAVAALLIAWRRRQLARLTPALMGAAAGFAALAVQIRYQPYYFETCYPFFAIFWAYLAIQACEGARFLARFFLRRNWRVARVLIWVVFAGLVAVPLPGPVMRMVVNYQALNAWRQNSARFYANYSWPGAAEDFRDVLRVVDFLKHHPSPPTGVYVWGNEPLIYYLSGHQPPTRFVWNLALIAPWRLAGWREQFMRQLSESHPRFIIVARDDEVHGLSGTYQDSEEALREFPALDGYLRTFYRSSEDYGTFEVYCRIRSVFQ
ncbi:MAG TPA: glycosyltransferase family 39 protein [Terriglobia bacterium]|nr:glycosyltransferase family 39 protein [Terriglobia bacterium]